LNLYENHDSADPLFFSGTDYTVRADIYKGNVVYKIKLNEGSAGFLPLKMYEWVVEGQRNDKFRHEAQKAVESFAEDAVQSWIEKTVTPWARLQQKVFLIQRILENILQNERLTQELHMLCSDNKED
jgi:hypothetical protein